MPMTCSICQREDRAAIDADLKIRRMSIRDIASRYGTTDSSVQRHASNCLKLTIEQVKELNSLLSAEHLSEELTWLHGKIRAGVQRAEDSQDDRLLATMAREFRADLELMWNLTAGHALEQEVEAMRKELEELRHVAEQRPSA